MSCPPPFFISLTHMSPPVFFFLPTHASVLLHAVKQGCSCSTSEGLQPGKSARNSTSSTYTSLPPRRARKSHRPFNSGINDQQEHTGTKTPVYGPTRVYTDRGWSAGEGGGSAEGEVPRRREMRCGEGEGKKKKTKTQRVEKTETSR